MLNLITKSVAKVFGTKSDRDIKTVKPLVDGINNIYKKMHSLSHDELRDQTRQVSAAIDNHLKSIDEQIADLQQQAENVSLDVHKKESLFEQIDNLEKERNKELEVVLNQQLPLAFAIMRETARRFLEHEEITVTASDFDQEIAVGKPYISIENGQATWLNHWPVRGNDTVWNMVHYDVQLIGGIVLHQGKAAEMATGEGKTLVATLPAFLNALAKRGVHIITVNDYLAKRDCEWMTPLFEFHGLRVDCIDKHKPNSDMRRQAYAADITYGTNNEFGFDYLRDNMAHTPDELVQRRLHYAMLDEVDSILIDEARTPLIISGPIPKHNDRNEQEFDILKPRIERLVDMQKKLVMGYLNEAKKKIAAGDTKEGGLSLFRAFRGLPKYKPLIKYLSEPGIKMIMQKTENFYLQDNQKMMPEADRPLYFVIDERHNNIDMTGNGLDFMAQQSEDPNFFIMPDLSIDIDKIDKDTSLTDEARLEAKNDLMNDYGEKSHRLHSLNQLLRAYTLFEKDAEYIVNKGKVMIVDEQTGRVMEGRRYSDGLHQAIEAKENVKVEDATQTYATVTLQNYFRMYHKLAGMTGTAETEAGEFWEIYKLDVVVIPTNRPIQRKDLQDKVFRTLKEKYNAVIDEIVEMREAGRPTLVGTTSVENSELIGRLLKMRGIEHEVLNAKQHEREAEIVAKAGQPGAVTIATNMAGRGTDIKLAPDSKASGGLAIIGTERHESRRVDRQLRGRAGRQGDPGSSQFFVSLEDSLMRLFGSDRIPKIMATFGMKLEEGEVIQHSVITKSIERAQRKVEENNFATRKRLLEYDDVMNSQRSVVYKRRHNALFGDRLGLDLMIMTFDLCQDIIAGSKPLNNFQEFKLQTLSHFSHHTKIEETEFQSSKAADLVDKLYREVYSRYQQHADDIAAQTLPVIKKMYEEQGETVKTIVVPFTDGERRLHAPVPLKKAVETDCKAVVTTLEKFSTLSLIDQSWMEHLREMDDLKQSVQNAHIEQKDPLIKYKFKAAEMFRDLIGEINHEVVSFLNKASIPVEQPQDLSQRQPARQTASSNRSRQNVSSTAIQDPYAAAKGRSTSSSSSSGATSTARRSVKSAQPIKSQKVDRNQRVTVRYANGQIKRDVKFKQVEQDINMNKCALIQE